ncbi:MAG TPA: hypothetical protein VFQ95_01090 [Rhodanobacteraceae bacterium]|nr:hypothetical protein [Rhodanobacteraceae bacterium]
MCALLMKVRWYAFLSAVALLALPAIQPAIAGTPPVRAQACASGTRWIVSAGSLLRSRSAFPVDRQREYLDSPCTFLIEGRSNAVDYRGRRAARTASATSIAMVARAARDPAIVAVLYDPEAWKMTPRAEQRDPVAAACKAETIAHAHGKLLIVAPAVDLLRVLAPGRAHPGGRYALFERLNLADHMARRADVYEVQAQGAEANGAKFSSFVHAEARQVRASNPCVLVLAGLSTNPSGQRVTAQQVYAAAQSVRGNVDGYWLNIPAGGKACPRCGVPQPQVAVRFLGMLAANNP